MSSEHSLNYVGDTHDEKKVVTRLLVEEGALEEES